MSPLNDKTAIVLPLGWVVSSCAAVTITVCSFFWNNLSRLQNDVHSLQVDIAVIKAHVAPQTSGSAVARNP